MELLYKRVIALIIDVVIVFIPSIIINFILNIIGVLVFVVSFGFIGLWIRDYIIVLLLFFLYEVISENLFGQTVGKKLMNIKVTLKEETLSKIMLRAIIKSISIYSFYYLFAAISFGIMVFKDPSSSIHDMAVDSKVELV